MEESGPARRRQVTVITDSAFGDRLPNPSVRYGQMIVRSQWTLRLGSAARKRAGADGLMCRAGSSVAGADHHHGRDQDGVLPDRPAAIPELRHYLRDAGAGGPRLAAVDGEMLVVGGTGPVPSPFPADRSEGRNQDPAGVCHPWPDV